MRITELRAIVLALLAITPMSCTGGDPSASSKPAKVERIQETALNRLTLTQEAVDRLAIQTSELRESEVRTKRIVGAEVIARPGAAAAITAPVSGIIVEPATGSVAVPGAELSEGEIVLQLAPFVAPNPDLQLHTRRDLEHAKARAKAARLQAERFRILMEEGAGDQSASEAAEAEASVAEAELAAAKRRLARVSGRNPLSADVTLPLRAPRDSVLLRLQVAPGQPVVSGQPLFEVADLSTVWIQVPLYIGDLGDIDRELPARIVPLARNYAGAGITARAIGIPAVGDPASATVTLFFEVTAPDHGLAPGQRVRAEIPALGDATRRKVVPWSSVLYDLHGNTWLYTSPEPLSFVRHSIIVDYVDGELAVLSHGPPAGTAVVTTGATELFGTEFGVGK